jgi:hypothetical protein
MNDGINCAKIETSPLQGENCRMLRLAGVGKRFKLKQLGVEK